MNTELVKLNELVLELRKFLGGMCIPVSMGQNCNAAWYLKQVHAKSFSGPFDWIYSSAEILKDCLDDNFQTFLDVSQMYSIREGKAAGHKKYHASMFNHRNPLSSEDNYDYYVRCVNRFLELVNGNKRVVFVCNLVNEPEKRAGWADGFTGLYGMPVDQDYSFYSESISHVLSKNVNSKFVFIDQLTESKFDIVYSKMGENIFTFKISAIGENNGIHFFHPNDDKVAKIIYSVFR